MDMAGLEQDKMLIIRKISLEDKTNKLITLPYLFSIVSKMQMILFTFVPLIPILILKWSTTSKI
jgi:hypothetical protein